jgi:hypothetical protein
MLKFKDVKMIMMDDWDDLVVKTYNRPYCFQQQNGCRGHGTFNITIPSQAWDFENDTVPEEINGDEMGVSFAAWLARDPNEWNGDPDRAGSLALFWERNFYPDIQMIANDLHAKGLVPAGDYCIVIDW